jgi:hypothetical protein
VADICLSDPGRRWSTHFASNLLEIFGGGIAQAFRLMLVADLLERRHGGFQNLGGPTFVFDVGPVKNLLASPTHLNLSMAFVLGLESPDSIVAGIPASALRRIFCTSWSTDMVVSPSRRSKRLPLKASRCES